MSRKEYIFRIICNDNMKTCVKCNKKYDEDMKFCPYCGYQEEEEILEKEDLVEDFEDKKEANTTEEDLMNEVEQEEDISSLNPDELAEALAAAKAAGNKTKTIEESDNSENEKEDELPKNKLPKVIAITVIVMLLIGAGVVAWLYFSSNGYGSNCTSVVKNYLAGYQEKDINKVMGTYPEFVKKEITKNSSPQEIWDDLSSTFADGLGEDWKATYTMGEVSDISETDISALKSDLQTTYNTKLDFTSGNWVAATMHLSGSKTKLDMPLMFAVVKIDGKYCIVYQTTRQTSSSAATTEATK